MKNKNQILRDNSKHGLAVFAVALLLICIVGYTIFDVAKNVSSDPVLSSAQKVEALDHVHYRFRRIYNGADMSARKANGSATYKGPITSRPSYHSTSAPVASGYSAASATSLVVPMNESAAALTTTSSQSQHSYGGGASATAFSASSSAAARSIHTESSATYAYTSITLPVGRQLAVNSLASATTADDLAANAGPLRAFDGDDGDDKPEGWDDPYATPVGDVPASLFLLLLSCYVVFSLARRKKMSLQK